ncbi:MAG: redox-sensing transcriptional repressor Rex [Lachnospiraceae bacterium]|nr:redox-sensing transcriptional repressor Rex [Lachnospiraceae bacterium]MEE1015713.1 redox-sensing transcriptional repressor Rex [Lachnospiraceae bacterium]
MEERQISKAVIKRLPRYYRYLGEILDSGMERISSGELSSRMKVTASQIRQDLNHFGGFGQQGYGYNVKYLHDEIGKILGIDQSHNMVVIGGGNMGQALSKYASFEKNGFKIKGIFDVNPDLIGKKIGNIQIYPTSDLREFVKREKIEIAVLTLPKSAASEMADILVSCGIKAIWNFAHTDLNVPKDVVVENVHLFDSLLRLSYNLSSYEKE